MANEKKGIRITKRGRLLIYAIILIFLICITVIVMKLDYFNIKTITVEDNLYVTTDEITAFADVKGQNIFFMNMDSIVSKIKNNPYVDKVMIERKLPSQLVIKISEKSICAIAEYKGSYVNIDSEGKMVQVVNEFPNGQLPVIIGVQVDEYLPGRPLIENNEMQMSALKKCLTIKDYEGMGDILKAIDISDPSNIILKTNKGIDIIIGDWEDMEYRLSFAVSVLNNPKLDGKTGCIEVYSDGKAIFREDNQEGNN